CSLLTTQQIWMHSQGWVEASGCIHHRGVESNKGVAYPATTGPANPDSLPNFGTDGPMNPNTDYSAQSETSIAVNPTNGAIAISSAIDHAADSQFACASLYNTTNTGNTWARQCYPQSGADAFDPSMAYSPDGADVYQASIYGDENLLLYRSTNNGQTWNQYFGINDPVTAQDREYLWVDRTVGPRRGTIYVTWTAFDHGDTGSTDNIAVRSSTDQGITWSNTTYVATNNVFSTHRLLQFASLAPLPSGDAVAVWLDDASYFDTSGQKIRWARTTDGGASFPTAGGIAVIPNDQSVSFNSTLPPKTFRTNAAPNVAADPLNGHLYAVWAQYRQHGNTQAGIYLATSTNEGNTWSSPTPVLTRTDVMAQPDQFMPWVSVSPDHRVHITWGDSYEGANNYNNINYNWWYIDSTDGGATFEAPVKLSSAISSGTWDPGYYPQIGDYSANYVTADTLYTTWTDNRNAQTSDTDVYFRAGTICTNPFVDIGGDPYYAAIHNLNCAGAVSGTDPTHFSPTALTTRAAFAKIVVLAFAIPLVTPPNPSFTDVPPTYWAYTFIESAKAAGVMSGYTGTQCTSQGVGSPCFLPGNYVTRAEATKTVVSVGGYTLINPPNPTYTDVPTNYWAYQYIETAHAKGILDWAAPPLFYPNNSTQRDEVCQIVYGGIVKQRL
ncbi:MAG: hypothetical protein DLM69_05015, partial [Candidatus Chloroheliales bacterium]